LALFFYFFKNLRNSAIYYLIKYLSHIPLGEFHSPFGSTAQSLFAYIIEHDIVEILGDGFDQYTFNQMLWQDSLSAIFPQVIYSQNLGSRVLKMQSFAVKNPGVRMRQGAGSLSEASHYQF